MCTDNVVRDERTPVGDADRCKLAGVLKQHQ